MKKKSTSIVSVTRGAVMAATQPVRSRRRNRQRTTGRSSGTNAASQYLQSYVNTLNDPFEYEALRIGFNCLVSSSLSAGFLRTSFTVNADGTFAVYSFPGVGNGFLTINTSGAAGTTWTGYGAANLSSLQIDYRAARVISGGIRCFALFPETSASGVLFAGTLPISTRSALGAMSQATLANAISSHLGIGTRGATALMRPQDNDSYVFYANHINGWNVGDTSQMSVPYLCGSGFPAGTVIWVEALQNLECLASSVSNVSSLDPDAVPMSPTASSYFPSVERMVSAVLPYLSNAAVMEGVAYVANRIVPGSGAAVRALSRFSQGRVLDSSRRSHDSWIRSRGRESSVMIEEMRDDAAAPSTRGGNWLRV